MGGNGMHVAPNPGPPIKKVHDCSFDREKTLMRTIETEGMGEEAREGAVVVLHLTVTQPNSEGELVEVGEGDPGAGGAEVQLDELGGERDQLAPQAPPSSSSVSPGSSESRPHAKLPV